MLRARLKIFILILGNIVPTFLDVNFYVKTIFLTKIRDFKILCIFYLFKDQLHEKLHAKHQLWEISYLSSFLPTIYLWPNKKTEIFEITNFRQKNRF